MLVRVQPSAPSDKIRISARVAQLVERLLAKEKVAGSNPVSRSFYLTLEGHLAQLVERFVYIEDVGGPSPSVATLKICRCGEIGIHVRLRCVCRKVWGFKSLHRH